MRRGLGIVLVGLFALFIAVGMSMIGVSASPSDSEPDIPCGTTLAPRVYPDGGGDGGGSYENHACNGERHQRAMLVGWTALGGIALISMGLLVASRRDPVDAILVDASTD